MEWTSERAIPGHGFCIFSSVPTLDVRTGSGDLRTLERLRFCFVGVLYILLHVVSRLMCLQEHHRRV